MDEQLPVQDDLLLIMQSYVDAPPQPVKARQTSAKPVAPEARDSDEDEVELAIQIELDNDEGGEFFGRIHNDAKIPSLANPSSDDSDSDSDSSSDVELRVTKYPTRKPLAFQASNDSDIEDDEGASSGLPVQYAGTKNEVLLPEVKAPELVVIPPEEVLELIGEVMTVIDSVVVIKGYTSGADRVLDTDSLLVFEDRNVFGVVFETFGAVKQPLYSVRFPSASAIDKDTIRAGRQVFHVPTRSNFVFTREIARIKGSDASNLHDEEVGDDQLDFSDDEAEAQWRRNRKEAKRGQPWLHDSANSVHEGTPKQPKPELPAVLPYPVADDGDVPYSTLPYDDVPDPRPAPAAYDPYLDHDNEVPTVPTGQPAPQINAGSEPSGSRGRGRDRGRRRGSPNQQRNERHNDDRGRPRRGRGGRGRGRGDRRQGRGGGNFSDQYPTDHYPDPSSMMYAMANATGQYPHALQDEGYNPVNGAHAHWEQGAMPHINPRFFAGELGAGANGGFGMQWPMGQSQNYGYQQPGYEYGGYNHQNDENYGHIYGNSTYWTPDGQPYTSSSHEGPSHPNS